MCPKDGSSGSTANRFFNVTGLIEEVSYYFEIKAFDDVPLESVPLKGDNITIDITRPNPPSGLKVKNIGGTFVELRWINSTSIDVMGYKIYINDTGSTSSFHHLTNTTDNYLNITGLLEETGYCFKIRAFDEVPLFSVTTKIFVTTLDITPPSKPTGLKTVPDGRYITLSWNPNPETDISGYQIFMNDTGSGGAGPFHFVKSVGSASTQTIVDSLLEETKYYFFITAYDERPNYSQFSEIVSTTTLDITPPRQPTGLKATVISGIEIRLTWVPNTENDLEGYLIYMKDLGAGAASNYFLIHILMGFDSTYIVQNLSEETTYQFKIKAFDEVPNNSSFSIRSEATTPDETPPMTPTGLYISKATVESFTLRWKKNTDSDVVGYIIFRRNSSSITFNQINAKPIDDTKYIDSGLWDDSKYYYKIAAIDEVKLQSDFSNVASGKTLRIEVPPGINNTIKQVIMNEDTIDDKSINLYHLFKDNNNDPLSFWYEGGKYIQIEINHENGNVTVKPEENYWGSETITFYASDEISSEIAKQDVIIDVLPVNDPPHGLEILAPYNNSKMFDGGTFEFKAKCEDIDLPSDELTFKWYDENASLLGTGEKIKGMPLKIGTHRITVVVTDSFDERLYDRIWVSVLETDESDNDDDGMPNVWERKYGFDELDPTDGIKDRDNDGLINYQEYLRKTDPLDSDTDSDGLSDGYEISLTTDPNDKDTDDDRVNDNLDEYPLDPQKWKRDEIIPPDEEIEPGKKEDSGLIWAIMGSAIAVIIVVLIIIFLLITTRKKREKIMAQQQAASQNQPQFKIQVETSYCSTCRKQLTFIQQVNKHYCYICKKYE